MNGKTDTNTLKDMKGLSNLKLNGSKNQGFKPTIVDDSAVNQSIFLEGNKINNKEIISTFDMERLKSLRRLFIRENICFDDVEKIQITINELINLKKQIIPIYDIGKFIVNPLMIIATSFLTIFLDHLTQSEDIRIQATFLLFILLFILIIIALVLVIIFMFVKPIIKLVFRKYDDFISDLKLLQVMNYK